MIKYRCPAPTCYYNKKGICCKDCKWSKKYKSCSNVCLNDVNKCGAKACEKSHNKVKKVVDNCFEKADKFKYPTRIVCEMEDGKRISYYRSERMV
jgi:hypothetical protein